jgi:hypothetical protein
MPPDRWQRRWSKLRYLIRNEAQAERMMADQARKRVDRPGVERHVYAAARFERLLKDMSNLTRRGD